MVKSVKRSPAALHRIGSRKLGIKEEGEAPGCVDSEESD